MGIAAARMGKAAARMGKAAARMGKVADFKAYIVIIAGFLLYVYK